MAKIVNGSLVLDPNDHIDFVDNVGISHTVYWDDLLDRFLFDGTVEADQFVGTTNSAVAPRNPQPNDDAYEVPTVWVNSTTNNAWILVSSAPGNAIWKDFGDGAGSGDLDHRITINDGLPPTEQDPFDMWITIDD
jgi:hypothetical protein